MVDKIRISWDDVNNPEVDTRLKQQQILQRAQQHHDQFAPHSQPSAAARSASTISAGALLSHAILALTLFGCVGGVTGWGLGETVLWAMPNADQKFSVIKEQLSKGNITLEEARVAVERIRFTSEQDSVLQQMLWITAIAIAIAVAISVAEPTMSRNLHAVTVNAMAGTLLGSVGGILVSVFINTLYNTLGGGGGGPMRVQIFARAIGWGVLGLFLAIAPGIVLRSWKRSLIGLAGGFLGGLVGGLLFDPIEIMTDSVVLSRFCAVVAIGAITAAGTGLLEQVAKTGWLRVTAGLIAGKQFILYRNPTFIGSSPQCEIYLFKDPQIAPRHAAVHQVSGGFEIEDLQSQSGTFVNGRTVRRVRLRSGDQIQIGATSLVCQEKISVKGQP